MNKLLCQFMTPTSVAKVIANELGDCDVVIDFAAGEGALLHAVQQRSKNNPKMIGFDIDRKVIKFAENILSQSILRNKNGLTARLDKTLAGRIGVVGNPPFMGGTSDGALWLSKAFSGLGGKLGMDRAEVQFLARSLVTARSAGGRVVYLMPIGFADGDIYRRIRMYLMQQYRLVKCIEIAAGTFLDTEARTVILIIDTAKCDDGADTEICELAPGSSKPKRVIKTWLEPGARLDARYHKAMLASGLSGGPQLGDLKVLIDRGVLSRKEAQNLNIRALHTTDIGRAKDHRIMVAGGGKNEYAGILTAKKGDILLPRTGSRVRWEPVIIHSGEAPITDHVFRIRAAENVRDIIYRSLCHPDFNAWLVGASKGVCATVLTKRELLKMPLFAGIHPI